MTSPVDTPVRPAEESPSGAIRGGPASSPSWQVKDDRDAHVGPQFPDLFQKAMQGSHLADNITVNHTMDGDAVPGSFASSRSGGSSPGGTPVGASSSPSTKRRWRKGS